MEQVRKQCNRAVYAWAFHAKWHLCNLPRRKNVDSIFLLEHMHVWCFEISRSVNLALYWSLDPCVYGCIYRIVKICVCILICQDKQTFIYVFVYWRVSCALFPNRWHNMFPLPSPWLGHVVMSEWTALHPWKLTAGYPKWWVGKFIFFEIWPFLTSIYEIFGV